MNGPAPDAHEEDHKLEERHFVEDFSLYFEQMGYPRMAGRILGWLLICEPPVQSAGELADVLGASKGSLSTMTRLLIQVGLVERAGLPGSRRDYFRIKPGAWPRLIRAQMQSMIGLHQMVERGLAMLTVAEGRGPESTQRLREAHDLYAFLERELPALLSRWQEERTARREEAVVRKPTG
jgi:DNA-binding transcriptional regulator GbsR (MarR family)